MTSGFDSSSESVLGSWLGLLRRRWLAGALAFAVVFSSSVFSVYTARTIYRADTKLRISEPPPSTGVGTSSLLGIMRVGGDPFANDLELISSRTVIEGIVRDAVLTFQFSAPAGWHRDSLFTGLSTTDQTRNASYEAVWLADGRIEVRELSPSPRAVGAYQPGAPVQLSGVSLAFQSRRANGPERVRISTLAFGDAVRRTTDRVKASRKRRDANVAEIVYTDADPALARLVVASALRRFIELRTSIAQRESGQNVDSLRAVARQTLAEVSAAEADLERLQRETLLVDPGAQTEAFVDRYSEVSTQLEQTRAELQAITAVLERASAVENAAQRWTRLLAYRPFLTNLTVGELLTQLNALEEKRAGLAPRRTLENREYSHVVEQIAYIDQSLSALARDIKTTLAEQEQRLVVQLTNMDAALAAIPRNAIELARRQRSARVLSEVMVLTEQRLRQEELRQALSFSNVQVIDAPALRYKPVWPRKKLGVVVGFLIASFCGLLALSVSEHADRRVRRAQEVMRITKAPVLGVGVRAADGLRITPHELRAVVHHASANGRGPLRIVVAAVGRAGAQDIVELLRTSLPAPEVAGVNGPEISQAASVTDFASASAAAGSGVPIALVIEAGRTTRSELARAAEMIEQAGGRIGGTVILSRGRRGAADVWA